MRKIISIMLIIVFVLSSVSFASCGKSDEDNSGRTRTSGTSYTTVIPASKTDIETTETEAPEIAVDWTLDEEGTLKISGEGRMRDFTLEVYAQAPWHPEKDKIKTVIIEKGILSIGEWAFEFSNSLTNVSVPDGVTFIGDGAFYRCISLKNINLPDSVTTIGDWVFSGCDDLTIYCSSDSYAAKYAKDCNIAAVYIDELEAAE